MIITAGNMVILLHESVSDALRKQYIRTGCLGESISRMGIVIGYLSIVASRDVTRKENSKTERPFISTSEPDTRRFQEMTAYGM